MKKLVFWGVIAAMFILGGGGAGAYISHTNAVSHNNSTYNKSNNNNGKPVKSGQSDDKNSSSNKEDNQARTSHQVPAHQTKMLKTLAQAVTTRIRILPTINLHQTSLKMINQVKINQVALLPATSNQLNLLLNKNNLVLQPQLQMNNYLYEG